MTKPILVIGSINKDLVVKPNDFPNKGETVLCDDILYNSGGKGANQASAIGKLKGKIKMVGACGDDKFGQELKENLKKNGVNIENIKNIKNVKTGTALIIIDQFGDNRIIVVKGANEHLTYANYNENKIENLIKNSQILLLQMEIPLATINKSIDLAQKHQTKIILDPAPVKKIPKEILKKIDYILPNAGELDLLVSQYTSQKFTSTKEKAEFLLNLGIGSVIVTCGEKGVEFYSKKEFYKYPALKVEVVDTTAAGDTFAGAFAFGLSQNWETKKSLNYAIIASSISVTRLGAQASIPNKSDIDKFIQKNNLKFN